MILHLIRWLFKNCFGQDFQSIFNYDYLSGWASKWKSTILSIFIYSTIIDSFLHNFHSAAGEDKLSHERAKEWERQRKNTERTNTRYQSIIYANKLTVGKFKWSYFCKKHSNLITFCQHHGHFAIFSLMRWHSTEKKKENKRRRRKTSNYVERYVWFITAVFAMKLYKVTNKLISQKPE